MALQVVQYLLANNYYLTALELLVESQQAGHGEQVQELQVQALFHTSHQFHVSVIGNMAVGCVCVLT